MRMLMVFCCWLLMAGTAWCKPAPGESAESPGPGDSTMVTGKKIYTNYCLACHQSDGSGVPGMYPPLTDTAWLANKEKLVEIVLEGLSGKITVNGKTYNQMMPTHNFLGDEEIAAVLSYIRKAFGDIKEPVLPREVAAQREN